MLASRGVCLASVAFLLGGCAVIPDIPSDFTLPVQAILAQTACELQYSFLVLDSEPQFARFKAKKWLLKVTLAPKADTEVVASAGLTRKTLRSPTTFTSWAVSGPGIQSDNRSERSSSITYNFKSAALMQDNTLLCPPAYPSINVLAQHLGVGDWLNRSAAALAVAKSAIIDSPIYDTQITITFSGNGSYTYTFAPGTNFASLSGSYALNVQLNISMSQIADAPPPVHVTSLPIWQDRASSRPVSSTAQVQAAQTRLDLIGIEQAIRKLQLQ